jgi:hypothetical protein
MFMIRFDYGKCSVINLMIAFGMLEMNCMINGLVIRQCVYKHDMLRNLWINQT